MTVTLAASFVIPIDPGYGPQPTPKGWRTALIPKDHSLYGPFIACLHDSDPSQSGRPMTAGLLELDGRVFLRVTALHGSFARLAVERLGNGVLVGGGNRLLPCGDWGIRLVTDVDCLLDTRSGTRTDRVEVHLLSPTTFRQGDRIKRNRHANPLPEPTRIVGSWLSRLELFAGAGISELLGAGERRAFLEWVHDRVWLASGLALTATTEATGKGKSDSMLAARGSFGLQITDPEGPRRMLVRALARFAEFSGTGYGTMHGFGQTATLVNRRDGSASRDALVRLLRDHRPLESRDVARLCESRPADAA